MTISGRATSSRTWSMVPSDGDSPPRARAALSSRRSAPALRAVTASSADATQTSTRTRRGVVMPLSYGAGRAEEEEEEVLAKAQRRKDKTETEQIHFSSSSLCVFAPLREPLLPRLGGSENGSGTERTGRRRG